MDAMPLTVPPPEQIRRRIADCEVELRSLRRLLRLSAAARAAAEASQRRPTTETSLEMPEVRCEQ
jgi:hypothetical protein